MLLPLAFLLAALEGFLDQAHPNFSAREVRAAGITANLVKVVAQSSADARRGRWILLLIGVILLIYATHSLYRALFMTHMVAWEMTTAKLHPTSMAIAGVLLALLPVVGGLGSLAREWHPGALLVVGIPAGLTLYSALWLWISWLLPRRADHWGDLVPGALVWGTGILALQLISVFVLTDRLAGMAQLYGALATASTTMAWLFLFGRLTVLAASLNALLWDRRLKSLDMSKAA
jgi:uncharacterized BrkB/YihY/UPF0761 family membrane protein